MQHRIVTGAGEPRFRVESLDFLLSRSQCDSPGFQDFFTQTTYLIPDLIYVDKIGL